MIALPCNERNHLLDALPVDDYEHLLPHLELIPMALGTVLHEPGDDLHYAYFPTTCIVAMLYEMENGSSAEIAIVGNEGMIGVALFMGSGRMVNRAVVVSPGYAYRIKSRFFMPVFNQYTSLFRLILLYTQALMTQMSQTAVCNRYHVVEQQLCRWILQCLDRLASNELSMTQELIATMLGVRRESVTEAAMKLQQAGLIDYRRGHITMLDRAALEARVCECYQVVKMEFDRLLPSAPKGNSSATLTQLFRPSTLMQ